MMGAYLDRLNAEFDEITAANTEIIERAAAEDRDLTDDENATIDRADKRRDELTKVIEHHQALEDRTNRVLEARAKVRPAPVLLRSKPDGGGEYDITKDFPTAGHYAMTLHRAVVNKDPEAIEKIERATANQTTADNPGIIPRPLVGPLINSLPATRPLIASVPNRPATAPKFDRPKITQHVDVQKQAAEKQPTASRQMTIDSVPVALDTYAGHVNVSRQDLRWTQPSILQVLFDDFTRVYAQRTDAAACTEFPADIAVEAALADYTPAAVEAFLRKAVGTVAANASGAVVDTIWMSPDVWAGLGASTITSGAKAYNLPLTGGGDVLGLRPVLDPQFAAQTLIVGAAALAEYWEDLDGFITVDEPDVLGQMVGYAGYADFVVVDPGGFVRATGLPAPTDTQTTQAAGSGSDSTNGGK
jgi:HK97 family phage major capsid protein